MVILQVSNMNWFIKISENKFDSINYLFTFVPHKNTNTMKLCNDFFNKAAKAIDTQYFPTVKYYGDSIECTKVHKDLEHFNNGVMVYPVLINSLAKSCSTTKKAIHEIVKEFVTDFEGYNPKFN